MYDIVTIGGAMRDIYFYTDEGLIIDNPKDPLREKLIAFELGAKIYIKEVYLGAGGGASNTAAGMARLGLKIATITRVGQDREGDELIKDMKVEGIVTRFIQRDKKRSTGFSFIVALEKQRTHTIFAYRGTSDYLCLPAKIPAARWIYISSLSAVSWRVMLRKILKHRAIKVWNPSNIQLRVGYKGLAKFLKKINVLILNQDEARELVLSAKKNKDLSVKRLLKEIYRFGPQIVAITVGKKGAYAYNGQQFYFQKPIPVKVLNTTGAGDSFASGFISSLFYQPNNIQKALKWGINNSSSVVSKIGAQKGLLTLKQIKNPKIS